MKLLVFNNIKEKLLLVKASLIYTFQVETAYRVNVIASAAAAFILSISMILLVEISFSEGKTLAGYNRDEMLLFTLFGNISFMINNYTFNPNIRALIEDVNTGALDFVLIRPIPGLFYLLTRKINILGFIREALPGIVFMLFIINFSNIFITAESLIIGLVSLACGVLCVMYFQLMMSLPVFWFGESSSLLDLTYVFDYRLGRLVPFETVSAPLQIFFTSVIPVMVTSGVTTSIITNKSPVYIIFYILIITGMLLVILHSAWKKAIKSYTSASS